MPEIIWTCCFSRFAIFNTQPLWILIQGREQGQESHYIKPSNLSSAIILTNFLSEFFVKTCDEQLIEYTKLKETTL